MTCGPLTPLGSLGIGDFNGQHRSAAAQANSYSAQQAYLANQGADPNLTAAALYAQHVATANAIAANAERAQRAVHYAIKSTGIEAGEITAWRCWRVVPALVKDELYCCSVVRMVVWPPSEPMTGDVVAGLGVFSWKSKSAARSYGRAQYSTGDRLVMGSIKIWGEVVEHEDGYRAEYAQIESIDEVVCFPSWLSGKKNLNALRAKYGVSGG
jgi:hypothetical protein